MSKTPFLECVSEDPVVKALARQVVRLLNDPSLDRQQREAGVRKVQGLLLDHQAAVARKTAAKTTGKGASGHSKGAVTPAGDSKPAQACPKQLAAIRREFLREPSAEPATIVPPARVAGQARQQAENDGRRRTLRLRGAPQQEPMRA